MIDYISFVKISNAISELITCPDFYYRQKVGRSLEDFIQNSFLDWDTYSSDIKYSDYELDYK